MTRHYRRTVYHQHFYPRSPRGERPLPQRPASSVRDFYPRSPRGERRPGVWRKARVSHFYPRSPRGERRQISREQGQVEKHFYPRSPRGERRVLPERFLYFEGFLSTLPARGATLRPPPRQPRAGGISIHAPREGSDTFAVVDGYLEVNFYPRSPRGERRAASAAGQGCPQDFYPRSPRGERPIAVPCMDLVRVISIHAPREGSDQKPIMAHSSGLKFLSTLPARGATECVCGGGG